MVWRCGIARLPRRKYTKEFRDQAVRMLHEQKRAIPQAARRLVMLEKILANWVDWGSRTMLPLSSRAPSTHQAKHRCPYSRVPPFVFQRRTMS
ncbi:MAG: transposase [Nitrospira sp.]